jgi:anti-sigma factor RsiW
MTSQEARELFSAAYDAELDASTQREFESALASDTALAAEYAEFRALLQAAAEEPGPVSAPAPDLLPGVQRRLRARSRGRYYGDRFAERAGLGARSPLILAVVMLVLAGLAWFALRVVQGISV